MARKKQTQTELQIEMQNNRIRRYHCRAQALTSEEIIAVRKRLGLNQQEFWSTIGVTQSGGSRYESGREMPVPTLILFNIVYLGMEP